MGYVQMTLNDWMEMKRKLRAELLGVKQSFVRIGYALRKIEEGKLYEQDGYKSVAEFAKAEYGLEHSTVSRFMSINREYSIDGYSEQLRPEYAELGRSQLEEMLKLPEEDRQMVQQETSREDIRELKRFNKTAPETGVADDLQKLIEEFFKDHPEILNAVFSVPAFEESNIKGFVEIVNPGGNRSYKKGLFFLMMYENRITVKKFGGTPKDMTWWEFYQQVLEIFESSAAGNETWQNYFGGDEAETPKKEEEKLPEKETGTQPEMEKPAKKEEKQKKEEFAPAQKSKEPSVENKEPVVQNTKETEEQKSEAEEDTEETSEAATEIMEKPFGSRKDYIDSLTAYGMACYLVEEYQNKSFQLSFLVQRIINNCYIKQMPLPLH